MKRKYLSAVMLLIASTNAFADYTDSNKSIGTAGSAQDLGFFSLVGGLTGYPSCPYGLIYVDLATNGGKAQQAILVAAKLSEKRINVTYYVNTNTLCYLRYIDMN